MPIRGLISRLADVFVLALYAYFIFQILNLWTNPGPEDAPRVLTVTLIALFEMIIIHISIVLTRLKDWASRISAIAFYTLFAIGFSFGLPNNTILLIYAGVVASRLVFIFTGPTEAQMKASDRRSALATILYLGGIFTTIFLSGIIPEFGLNSEWMRQTNYVSESGSGGLYISSPHLALAFAVFYFSVLLLHDAREILRPNKGQQQATN